MLPFPALFLTCILIIVLPDGVTAQTKKGDWLIEGSFGNFSLSFIDHTTTINKRSSTYGTRSLAFTLSPWAGYFVTENLVIGGSLGLNYQGSTHLMWFDNGVKADDVRDYTAKLNIVPMLRFYFRNFNAKNRLYVQPCGGYGRDIYRKDQLIHYNQDGSRHSLTIFKNPTPAIESYFQLLIGYNHFFNPNFAVNTSIGYGFTRRWEKYYEYYDDGVSVTKEAPVEITTVTRSILWNLGFTYILNGKAKNKTP